MRLNKSCKYPGINGLNGRAARWVATLITAAASITIAPVARAETPVAVKTQGKAATAASSPPATSASTMCCNCGGLDRKYQEAVTPETRALFTAAAANDEAAFATALAQVKRPGDYALEGIPLLHILLKPPIPRSQTVYNEISDDEAARLRQAYRAVLPARTRMIAALLATKPALDDVTAQSRRSPLQLALLYGSPEIMDMLLAAGANPNQCGDDYNTPLEFLLNGDFEFAVRMTYLPRLPDRQETTRMVLALLKAGAARPFSSVDNRVKDDPALPEDMRHRPSADFAAWNPLVELTEGAEVVRALAATGTKPSFDNHPTPMALAAYTGNAGAVSALAEMGPRRARYTISMGRVTDERDMWLDAAQAAVIAGHSGIAVSLLRADMPFSQVSLNAYEQGVFLYMETPQRPIMNLAAKMGDVATLRRLLELGAPVEGDADEQSGGTPLADAVQAHKLGAVRVLLAAKANPALLRQVPYNNSKSALEYAIAMDAPALVRELLAATPPESLRALQANSSHSLLAQVLDPLVLPLRKSAEMLRQLVDGGVEIDADTFNHAMEDRKGVPPLLMAVMSNQTAIVDALLAKGADPLGSLSNGGSTLWWVIEHDDDAMLKRLLNAGARINDRRLPRAPASYALLNVALASGDMDMIRLVAQISSQRPEAACLPQGDEYVLLDKPGYFAQLQALGYTGLHNDCASGNETLPRRLLKALLGDRRIVIARRDTVADVLTRLKASGANLDEQQGELGNTPLIEAIELGRADLAEILLTVGASPDAADAQGRSPAWVAMDSGQPNMLALLARHHARFNGAAAPLGQSFNQVLACQVSPAFMAVLQTAGITLEQQTCPPAPAARPADALATLAADESGADIAGYYNFRDVSEVSGELLLSADGHFDYQISYKAEEIKTSGVWRVDGQRVLLDTPPIPPFSAIAKISADTHPAKAGMFTVRVYSQDRLVNAIVAMSSSAADYTGTQSEDDADGVSASIPPGELKALAVFVPSLSGARWYQADISQLDPSARALRIDLEPLKAIKRTSLHAAPELRPDGSLVIALGGLEFRYTKRRDR